MNLKDIVDDDDEVFLLLDDEEEIVNPYATEKWKVLIVDDEPAVHNTTKLVLKDMVFEGKRIELLSAYSSAEAKITLAEHDDIAIVLLDVVMESEVAGLNLIRYIRDEIGNKFIRIILRTGQPGQAPEEKIVIDYDINDYKTKTELTVQKLFTSIISSIRAYKDLITIERNRKGLMDILSATNKLFEFNSLKLFVSGLITQFTAMYGLNESAIFARSSGLAASEKYGELVVLAATGEFQKLQDLKMSEIIDNAEIKDLIQRAREEKQSILTDRYFLGYYNSLGKIDNFFLIKGLRKIDEVDRELIQLFSENISVAFDNYVYHERIINSQREVIYKLSEILENVLDDSDRHLSNVSKMSYELAVRVGVHEQEASLLSIAASLHDIGNFEVAKAVLNKPGALTGAEFDAVKQHTTFGRELLSASGEEVMSAASIIAFSHHENWDGTGYPLGLKGEQIHIYSRIVSVADVYDTLQRKTTYRDAWTHEQTVEFLMAQKGLKFDPRIVDIFVSNVDVFKKILDNIPFNLK